MSVLPALPRWMPPRGRAFPRALQRSAACALVAAWCLCSATSLAQTPKPRAAWAVLVDDELPLYRTVTTGVAVEAGAALDVYSLGGDVTRAPDILNRALAKSPPVIVAIGPKSANAARQAAPRVPLVYCMVPRPENYALSGPRVLGVRLERSYATQLEALKAMAPGVRRVAVVHDPERGARTLQEARLAAAQVDLLLVPVAVRAPHEAAAALEKGASEADALWMVSDPTVLNLQTFEAMLAFAAARKLPFFALNSSFVERGALLAFTVDYGRLGRQVGRLASRAVERGDDSGGLFAPEETELAINLGAAERLGDAKAFNTRVLGYAAEHKHALRVYR